MSIAPDNSNAPDALAARDLLIGTLRSALPRLLAHHPVGLAYLYGSTVSGFTHPFSDVDIALIVDDPISSRERRHLLLRLPVDLANSCDIRNADVRIINDAPLVFRGKVVTEGIVVYARTDDERVEFETSTRLHYFDYLPIHRQLQDAFFADVRERGLHGGQR